MKFMGLKINKILIVLIYIGILFFHSKLPYSYALSPSTNLSDISSEMEYVNQVLDELSNHFQTKINPYELLKKVKTALEILTLNKKTYGKMTTSKWLGHEQIIQKVKEGNFYDIHPITVQFAPTAVCKYNCPFCSYGESKDKIRELIKQGKAKEKDYFMSREDMFLYIDKIVDFGAKAIVFTGGGDPLLNEYTVDGMRYAKSKGLSVAIFTDGLFLTNKTIDEILNIGLTFLRISFNAGTPDTYAMVHGTDKSSYFKVLNSIRYFARKKNEVGSNILFGIGVIINPININTLMDIAQNIKEIGNDYPGMINYLAYRPTVRYKGACQHTQYTTRALNFIKGNSDLEKYYKAVYDFIYTKNVVQFPKEIFEIAIEKVENEIKPFLLQEPSINLYSPKGRLEGIYEKKKPFKKCLACPITPFIGPDGSLYHCVEHALNQDMIYGNLKESSFQELWQNEKRAKIVQFVNSNLETFCAPVCMLYEYNKIFNLIDSIDLDSLSIKKEINSFIENLRNQYEESDKNLLNDAANFMAPDKIINFSLNFKNFSKINLGKIIIRNNGYEITNKYALENTPKSYKLRLESILNFISLFIGETPLEINIILEPIKVDKPSAWYNKDTNTVYIQVILLSDMVSLEYAKFIAYHDLIIHAYEKIFDEKTAMMKTANFLLSNEELYNSLVNFLDKTNEIIFSINDEEVVKELLKSNNPSIVPDKEYSSKFFLSKSLLIQIAS